MANTTIPSKEAVVVILDIGLGMTTASSSNNNESTPIEDALKSVTLLYQQKLIYSKKDELGLVLIGTKGTKNNLQEDGYQHITVVSDIEEPTIETLKYLENLGPGDSKGDVIDSLIVAMDMLIKRTENKKYQKRIFLVTNAKDPINTEDLTIVKDQFKKIDVKLNIIGVDFTDEEELINKNLTNKEKNEIFLREFANSVDGVLVPVKQALEMMSFFRSQSVLQRTSFRGQLEISPELKIPVWGFLKMKQQNLPSLKKISALAQEKSETTTLDVNQETLYYSITDPDQEISKDDLLKGYKYGKSLIPFSKIDESQLKYSSTSRSLKVLGFVDRQSIPLYYNMGCSEMFVSQPNDKNAEKSLSIFIRAMIETNQAMLVRYVKTNGSVPYLGYMIPKVKPYNGGGGGNDENNGEEKFIECLYYNHLPLSDDIRQYQFPSLSLNNPLTRKSFIPSKEQLEASQKLIDSMDLMNGDVNGNDEVEEPTQLLKPSFTYNPLLQHFYQCLHHRSLHPNSTIPKLDPIISQYINPDEQILEKSKESIKEFSQKFPLSRSSNFNKSNNPSLSSNQNHSNLKYYWKDGILVSEEINLDSYVTDDGSEFKKRKINDFSEFSLNKLVSGYVNEVGTINPVQNFKDMLNRRDVDLVDKAINLMKERIVQLVNDSLKDQYYQKSYECIKELRNGCIRESEADSFNQFIKEIRTIYENKKKDDFWKFITNQSNPINLITEDECDSSSCTKEEADEFLNKKHSTTIQSQINTNTNTDSVDDLFDQIE